MVTVEVTDDEQDCEESDPGACVGFAKAVSPARAVGDAVDPAVLAAVFSGLQW